MEYSLGKKEAKNIKVDYIFKLDTLENHLQECVSVIIPTINALPKYKHLYTPKNITDYYGKIKRLYESKKCEWLNRGELWQKN
tara:strand:+ start:4907 stop:5155 length:249 start_codon:yes stop_codon:yes gene_type:complete